MDGRTNPSTRKDLPPRFALITPSASPPSSRSSYASRGRRTDRAPSAKRPRLASTPSSAFSASTPSSSAQPDANQIDEDRRASSLRLMNFWSQLGERYNRPLDEDDIIDLRDGSLHKNRGVLQGVDHIYDLGYFAAGDGASDANATDTASEGGGPPENEDDDVDEIDAFAPEANISDELEMEKEKLHVPPVRAMDPADAEDLREFLEAEQRRKELHGDDEEDEEVDPMLLRGESLGLNWPNLFRGENGDEVQSAEGEDDGVSIYDGDGASVAYEEEAGHPVAPTKVKAPAVQKALLRVPSDDESEDEFATWDFDVSTPAPRPRTGQRPPDEDVIDLTDSPSPSPPPPPQRAKSRAPARGPSRPASRARSKSRPQARLPKTPPRSEFKTPPPPSPEPITQLFTPPRSSVSAVENTPDVLQSCDIEYPSPPPPPRVRPRPRPAYKGAQHSADTPTGSSTAVAPLPPRDPPAESCITKLKPTKTPKTVHTAEVVLTRRSRRPSTTVKITDDNLHLSKARRQDEHNNHEGEVSDPERRLTRKEKGKGKDLPSFVDSHAQSDTEHPDGQVSNTEAKKTAQKAKPRGKAKAKQKSDDVGTTPKTSHGLPSRTGKRKRIVSSSPAFGQSTNEQPSVDISPVAHVKSKISPKEKPRSGRARAASYASRRTTSVSPSHSGDESDGTSERERRSHSRAHSRAPQIPPPDPYAFMYPPPMPFTPRHHDKHGQYQHAVPPDPQAQFRIAQAIHHLSYLMNATSASSPGQGYPPGYPAPYAMPPAPWPPFTPPHREQRRAYEPSSSDAGSSAYAVPPHAYPFPYPFNPMFSDGTLPPSSPLPPSEPSSPIERSKPERARSKSRGRRVSFKLDDNDRPLPVTPQRHDGAEDAATHPRRGHVEIAAGGHQRGRSKSVADDTSRRSSQPSAPAAAKGKARAVIVSDESAGEDEDAVRETGLRGRPRDTKVERGRTPGPPEGGQSTRPSAKRGKSAKR